MKRRTRSGENDTYIEEKKKKKKCNVCTPRYVYLEKSSEVTKLTYTLNK